jgi:hypothetical protein
MAKALSCRIGAHAALNGRRGRVVATSGPDQTCIVLYETEGLTPLTSGWVDQGRVELLPEPEGEK